MSEERLNDLEARYAWLEKHVAEQDKVMASMEESFRKLRREVEAIQKLARAGAEQTGEDSSPEPPPPHY
jgi:uncharacterized coiled-coil protein SlyX